MAKTTDSMNPLAGWGKPETRDDSFTPPAGMTKTYKKPTQETQGVDEAMRIIKKAGRGLEDDGG